MQKITEFLDHLYELPQCRVIKPEEDLEHFLGHWGYTIYRTYYGPGSNEQWSKLLENITNGVEVGLLRLEEADKEPDAITKLRDQFRLDARSNPANLDKSMLENVRQVYLEGFGGQPMRGVQPCNWGNAIFLFADAEVLQDPDLCLLKVADANYDPVAAVPRNTRVLQRKFGWVTIPTTAVVDFFNEMDTFTFDEIVSHAGGGPGAFWDPDEQL